MVLLYVFSCLCFVSPIFAAQRGICSPNSEIIEELEKRYELKINGTSLAIKYDLDDVYVPTFTFENVDLQLNTANVIFTGFIKTEEKAENAKTHVNFNTKPILVRRVQKRVGNEIKKECKLASSENFDVSMDLPEVIEAAIIQMTEYCLQSHICGKFDSIVSNDFLQKQRHHELETAQKPRPTTTTIPDVLDGENGGDEYPNNPYGNVEESTTAPVCSGHHETTYNPQATINAMTDFGVSVVISHIATDGDGIVKIPDIHYNTTMGANFKIDAYNGTFKDLKTLSRMNDVLFTHDDLQFSMGATYHLDKAEVQFGYYKIKYGKVTVDGHLHVLIDGITLSAKVSVDYNNHPCKTYLNEMRIEKIGKIHVKLTGFGYLNKPISLLSEWIIKTKTFEAVKEALARKLYKLDCEKYRPYAKINFVDIQLK